MMKDEKMSVSELIEFAEKCARDNKGLSCASCKLADDLFCKDKIISALLDEIKNAEKYKWHDLIKNPDDLPNDDSIEYIVCVEYRNGKRKCTVGCLDMGGEMMLLPALGNWIGNGYHIIAWKEIEPFEE